MPNIEVNVKTEYLAEQSEPAAGQYIYTYTITISNRGSEAATLISRHWIITDANNKVQEVKGLGVVGEQPRIPPGESYTYTSGTVMETASGMMSGSYTLVSDSGESFEADIPAFSLTRPHALH